MTYPSDLAYHDLTTTDRTGITPARTKHEAASPKPSGAVVLTVALASDSSVFDLRFPAAWQPIGSAAKGLSPILQEAPA